MFIAIIVVYSIIVFICTILDISHSFGICGDPFWAAPNYIHDSTTMNWVGACLTALLVLIISPVVSIGRIIYWICHVGRH